MVKGNSLFFLFVLIVTTSISCFSEPVIREVKNDDYIVQLDLSNQVLSIEVKEDKTYASSEKKDTKYFNAKIYSDLRSVPDWYCNFISTAIVAQKAKNFDDGLLAAIEYLAQDGTGKMQGKQVILQQLIEILKDMHLKKRQDAMANFKVQTMIYSALVLGGGRAEVEPRIRKASSDSITVFFKNELRSKPIGFYSWTEKLEKIFKQDRFLQKIISGSKERLILQKALSHNKQVTIDYTSHLNLIEQLNNPFSPEFCDLRQPAGKGAPSCSCSVIPPSMAHETELVKQLYGNRPIPKGFSLIDALIKKIQDGKISITPKKTSGWYDYKTYALEPFIVPESMPEAAKLDLGDEYKQLLVEVFKSVLALTRETHIKSLEIPLAGAAMPEEIVEVYPDLSCGPVASYYLRLGKAYTFVKTVIRKCFTKTDLMQARRLMPYTRSQKPLLTEMQEMESLMYGLFLITAGEIGLKVTKEMTNRKPEVLKRDKETAQKWIAGIKEDIDLARDNRMMVPVFYDVQRRKTKVWAVLGYAVRPVTISYKKEPTFVLTNTKREKINRKVKFKSQDRFIIYPVSAEVYTNKILNRKEFQELCDKYKNQKSIIKAIEKLQ